MKKAFKWLVALVFTPIVLFVLLTVLLYLPPVQNWAVRHVAAYASEKTGMDIAVDHVRLAFPLDLQVDGFKMIQPRTDTVMGPIIPPVKDTVADIGRLIVDVQFLPLLKRQVEINALELTDAKVNTTTFFHEARIKGHIGRLYLQSHGISLDSSFVKVNTADLQNARLDVALSDTVPPDTTPSKNFWKVQIDDLNIAKTAFTLHMPRDTMSVHASMTKAKAHDTKLDLHKGEYQVTSLDWNGGTLSYDNQADEKKKKGFDANHIAMSDVNLGIDSLYYCSPKLSLDIRKGSFKERCGLDVRELSGPVLMTDRQIALRDLKVKTPNSFVAADFRMDMNSFDDVSPGKLYARLNADVGKQDMLAFLGDMPGDFARRWPNRPLSVKGKLEGNMQHVDFKGLSVKLPTAFNLNADGWVANPTDADRLRADVRLKGRTENLDFLTAMLPKDVASTVKLPRGISIDGHVKANGPLYSADLRATEGGGSVTADGYFNTRTMDYDLTAKAKNLRLDHFLPNQGLSAFTGDIALKGHGTDFLSPKSNLIVKTSITRFQYDRWNLDRIHGDIALKNGVIHADVNSQNPLLKGRMKFDGLLSRKNVDVHLNGDITHADLYRLRIFNQPLTVAGQMNLDFSSDLNEYYKVKGFLGNPMITDKKETYVPGDMYVDAMTRRDSTYARIDCSDLHLDMEASGGYKHLMARADALTTTVRQNLKDKWIDQPALRGKLPNGRIFLTAGPKNIVSRMLQREGYAFHSLTADLNSSPVDGVNGVVALDSLVYDSIRIDNADLRLDSDDNGLKYDLYVVNGKDNPTISFRAQLSGALQEKGSSVQAKIYDADDKLGLDVGLIGTLEEGGVRFNVSSPVSTIGYKEFAVNDGNYIFVSDDRRISADMKLRADDGAGLQVYTDDDDSDALQNITVTMHQFELAELFSILPFTPSVSGILDGDYHLVQTPDNLSVSTDINIAKLVYEHSPMGDVGTQFVYIPQDDGSHYVDGIISHNGNDVGTLVGTYRNENGGYLDANFTMDQFPLSFVNGFIPNQLFGLRGNGEGTLAVQGPLSKLNFNGEVYLDESRLFSVPYGVEMRFANDPVRIVNSHLLFENFEVFANNDSPLNISGELDFSDIERMMLNIRMRAENFQLIDAKENPRSEAYGKAFVNFFGMMQGPVNALKMRGKLDILGSTDMTYVLRESALATDNQLDELVRFTDFNDSIAEVVARPPLNGFDMQLNIDIDEAARIVCALNAAHSNYIDLIGGGSLRMTYNTVNDLRLNGRYTLNSGEMKFSLPAIPLRTFNIQDGSYVEFTGDAMNPTLNITATERLKANVADGTSSGRMVDFECGVRLTKSLSNPGVEFIIDAPEDMTMQNELNTRSAEERGKLAVSMLASGMYLDGSNGGNLSVNSALASFLQTEINSITGNALRSLGLDVTAGMENSTDASGNIHTDYSFKFSKRLWNNRLRIIMGGKVTTGSDASEENGAFFDNFSMEYRLNQSETQYLKLFYQRDAYDWLEGYVGEFGAGFMWRRKLSHFQDIFRYQKDEPMRPPTPIRRDSTEVPVPITMIDEKK